jgi:phosphoadenosine phosphosulfate reductase
MNALHTYDKPSTDYTAKLAASVAGIRQHLDAHPGEWTQAHSLGPEDVVVTQLLHLAGVLPEVCVFVLDTGKLHDETLALIPALEQRFATALRVFKPDAQAVVHFVRDHGERAMYDSVALRKACCDLRKMQPLAQALAGKTGWITGLRREQSAARAAVDAFGFDGQRHKLNPLADWTWGDVWHCVAQFELPYNALHDAFYPSIGCAPCTRAISLGEDFRAGRWWWEQNDLKECGLHVQDASAPRTSIVAPLSETTP